MWIYLFLKKIDVKSLINKTSHKKNYDIGKKILKTRWVKEIRWISISIFSFSVSHWKKNDDGTYKKVRNYNMNNQIQLVACDLT